MLTVKKAIRQHLLAEAIRTGKSRLERVSDATYPWVEREIIKKLNWLISVHPHGGPKTISPPQ